MSWWALALWGLGGGLIVEGLELVAAIKRVRDLPWRVPGEIPLRAYFVAWPIRVGAGAALAMAVGAGDQVTGALAAFMIGVSAPLIIEKAPVSLPGAANA